MPVEGALRRLPAPPLNAPKAQTGKPSGALQPQPLKAAVSPSPVQATASTPVPTKPAAKGSYAEMMARAREKADRAQNQVGTIRHQDTKKEKMSRLAERRKADQGKAKAANPDSKIRNNGKKDARRSASPIKKDGPLAGKASGTPPKAKYAGTMGKSTTRARAPDPGRSGNRKPRYDEYLGTDEEDDSGIDERERDDYGSDESDDMEAGFDDMELEDAKATGAAKEDDARELEMENKLKREKDERRRKLMAMAKKQK